MTIKTVAGVGLALILTALASGAEARTRHQVQATADYDRHTAISGGYYYGVQPEIRVRGKKHIKIARVHRERPSRHKHNDAPRHHVYETARTQPHPDGCPHHLFCGCGTAKFLLGKVVREGGLAIAANWLHFPRVACAPRMAAARYGHVFAILECLGNGKVLAYDPNSGGHQTRIHVRSLAGYSVVNPHGSKYASAQ